jgi:hypothetical protein
MTTPPTSESGTPAPAETPAPRKPRIPRWKWYLLAGVLSPLVLFILYTVVVLNWSYSEGDRGGTLQKYSRKGWLCKTWEGELAMITAPGVPPEIWHFSVRDDSVSREVAAAVGKRVVLHYDEHRGVPTDCFAQTGYFVTGVRISE